jgi:glycosyltransferase involved in cell wall biosynthesis
MMRAALRILEVVGSLSIGGAERVALEIAAGLPSPEFRAELLCAGPSVEPAGDFERNIETEARGRGVTVHRVKFSSPFENEGRRRLVRFLIAGDYDVVHVHNRPQDWQLVSLCRALGMPAVYTLHLPYERGRKPRARFARTLAGLWASSVVCVSKAVADHLTPIEHLPREKLRVIYNGINTDRYRPLSAEARRAKRAELGIGDGQVAWICVGRMDEQKGHRYLLDAMAALPAGSRCRLFLAGDGVLRPAIEEQVRALGLGERVTLLGARTDVPALLGAADAYASATLQEGHPLSVLEAMAVGLPVVAPRIAAISEIAQDDNPIFFGPAIAGWASGHDAAELAQVIARVGAELPGRRARAAEMRDQIAARYSPAAMLDAHAALYRTLSPTRALPLSRAVLATF